MDPRKFLYQSLNISNCKSYSNSFQDTTWGIHDQFQVFSDFCFKHDASIEGKIRGRLCLKVVVFPGSLI